MAHDYTGDATGITPTTPITIHEPDDGDPDNVASVNPTVFERLANWIKFVFTFVLFKGNASGGLTFNNVGPAGGTGLTLIGGGGAGNSNGANITGAGTGYGVRGAAVDGAGLEGDATGAGHGVIGTAAGTGSAIRGVNTGAGVAGEFDTSTGTGDALTAGAGNARAIQALNSSAAATVEASNAGSGPALKATATAAGHAGKALAIVDGAVSFDGGTAAAPAAATALLNKVTPKTIIKGWALVRTDGAGGITLVDGQNVSGASLVINAGWDVAKKVVQVDWAQGFASVDYGVEHFNQVAGAAGTGFIIMLTVMVSCTVAHAQVGFYDTGTSTKVDPGGPGGQACGVLIVALGAQ